MSFGGIPLLYYGDEIGTLNNYDFSNHESRRHDSRWIHRPYMDWERAELRDDYGTLEQRIYDGLKKLIAIRKHVSVFADFNNREHIDLDNEHIFAFVRDDPNGTAPAVAVVANFDVEAHAIPAKLISQRLPFHHQERLMDLCTGEAPEIRENAFVVPPFRCYWLTDDQAPLTA
jgi:amylosucrase